VRLRLPRGGWRIDHVARVTVEREVTPRRIAPVAIRGTLGRQFAAGRGYFASLMFFASIRSTLPVYV